MFMEKGTLLYYLPQRPALLSEWATLYSQCPASLFWRVKCRAGFGSDSLIPLSPLSLVLTVSMLMYTSCLLNKAFVLVI